MFKLLVYKHIIHGRIVEGQRCVNPTLVSVNYTICNMHDTPNLGRNVASLEAVLTPCKMTCMYHDFSLDDLQLALITCKVASESLTDGQGLFLYLIIYRGHPIPPLCFVWDAEGLSPVLKLS